MALKDPWYFPRPELATHILAVLDSGLVRRIALFAPRRKGKTWFLLRDLVPAARKASYVPVYASLWSSPDAPHVPIHEAIGEALRALRRRRPAWQRYVEHIQSVSLGTGFVNASLRPAAEAPVRVDAATLSAMSDALAEVVEEAAQSERRVMLVLDEAQHLATDKAFVPLAASLRSALDKLEGESGGIRTVFTGSSRTDMSALISDPRAPFYRSVEQMDFPDLDRRYAEFVAAQLLAIGGITVSAEACSSAFERVDRSPHYMEALVRELVLRRADSMPEALARIEREIAADPSFQGRWSSLKPLDREVYLAVCDAEAIFSRESLEKFSRALGNDAISTSHVQRSVGRLKRLGLVSSFTRGVYKNEAPEFRTWLAVTLGKDA